MAHFKVIVIGGGLSGALLTNGLLNNNVDTTLYERDAADSKREGYQIRLGEATTRGFEACLTEDQMAPILHRFMQSTSTALTAPTICNTRFQTIVDLTTLPSYSRSSAINRVVLRDLLLAPIRAKGLVRYAKTFARYEIVIDEAGRERVIVHFADGSSDVCDLLIGADGSGSKINKQVGARNIVDIDTHWSFLNKGALSSEQVERLPERLRRGPIIVFSRGISMFYSAYLPQVAASVDSHDGIHRDEKQASFYWGLNVPVHLCPDGKMPPAPDRGQFCLDVIRDWAPEFHDMVSMGLSDDGKTELYGTKLRGSNKLPKNWREPLVAGLGRKADEGHPRIWLMGDAVHAMQPNRGMGGNQAMRDCADILPEILELNRLSKRGTSPTNEEIFAGCTHYEDKMFDRAFGWVKKSGGTSMPNLDFDGFLGLIVSFVARMVMPVVRLFYTSSLPTDKRD